VADEPPPKTDVSPTRRLAAAGYQLVALLAMLAHLLIVGPLCLLTLVLGAPPGEELVVLALKGIVVAVWFGFGYLGIRAWNQKSWWVVAVPIVAFCLVFVVIGIGNGSGWYLPMGY